MPGNIVNSNDKLISAEYYCWCSHCDRVLVDSPEKGNFYMAFGHLRMEDGSLGGYEPVYFSLCKECDNIAAPIKEHDQQEQEKFDASFGILMEKVEGGTDE